MRTNGYYLINYIMYEGKKFLRALKLVFCAKERKRIQLERLVYKTIGNQDVDKMIELIKNGLDVNMEIRKSSIFSERIVSKTIWRPMDVAARVNSNSMMKLLKGVGAKTQEEVRAEKYEARLMSQKQKEEQEKKAEQEREQKVAEFLKK